MACICDWPDECSGLGIIECDGCGGDLCVCALRSASASALDVTTALTVKMFLA